MERGLLNLANQSIKSYLFQYLTAASFHKNGTIVAWFNGQALHSAALALNLVHNAISKVIGEDFGINLQNDPLKFLPKIENSTIPDMFKDQDGFGYIFAFILGMVMSILSASYIIFYIKVKLLLILFSF